MIKQVDVTFNFERRPVQVTLNEDEALDLLQEILGIGGSKNKLILNNVPPVPDANKIFAYIKTKPNYSFTIEEIVDQFLDKDLTLEKREKNRWINAIRAKISSDLLRLIFVSI